MATKRRGKRGGKSKGKSSAPAKQAAVAGVGSRAVAATALEGVTAVPSRKRKPRKKQPPKQPARRVRTRGDRSGGKAARKPAVKARRVASAGRKRIEVDHPARKRAERLIAQFRKRRKRVERDFYAMGQALLALSEPHMYRALGHETFEELLTAHQLVSRTAAHKLMSVARAYPRDQALDLGLERAYGIIRWSRASQSDRSPSELVESNAVVGNRRIRDMTVRALEQHVRQVAGAPENPQAGARRDAQRIARAMQRELRAQGLGGAKASARRLGGRWHVTVDVLATDAEAWLADEA